MVRVFQVSDETLFKILYEIKKHIPAPIKPSKIASFIIPANIETNANPVKSKLPNDLKKSITSPLIIITIFATIVKSIQGENHDNSIFFREKNNAK